MRVLVGLPAGLVPPAKEPAGGLLAPSRSVPILGSVHRNAREVVSLQSGDRDDGPADGLETFGVVPGRPLEQVNERAEGGFVLAPCESPSARQAVVLQVV